MIVCRHLFPGRLDEFDLAVTVFNFRLAQFIRIIIRLLPLRQDRWISYCRFRVVECRFFPFFHYVRQIFEVHLALASRFVRLQSFQIRSFFGHIQFHLHEAEIPAVGSCNVFATVMFDVRDLAVYLVVSHGIASAHDRIAVVFEHDHDVIGIQIIAFPLEVDRYVDVDQIVSFTGHVTQVSELAHSYRYIWIVECVAFRQKCFDGFSVGFIRDGSHVDLTRFVILFSGFRIHDGIRTECDRHDIASVISACKRHLKYLPFRSSMFSGICPFPFVKILTVKRRRLNQQ